MSKRKPKADGCLVCGREPVSRGLCDRHYRRFLVQQRKFILSEGARAFEEECIENGWILPKSKGGRPKEDEDPFDEIAARLIRLGHEEEDAEREEMARLDAYSRLIKKADAALRAFCRANNQRVTKQKTEELHRAIELELDATDSEQAVLEWIQQRFGVIAEGHADIDAALDQQRKKKGKKKAATKRTTKKKG